MAAILVFPPLDIETRRNVKSRFETRKKKEPRGNLMKREKESVCVEWREVEEVERDKRKEKQAKDGE